MGNNTRNNFISRISWHNITVFILLGVLVNWSWGWIIYPFLGACMFPMFKDEQGDYYQALWGSKENAS